MDKEAESILSQMNCLEEDFMALSENVKNLYGTWSYLYVKTTFPASGGECLLEA